MTKKKGSILSNDEVVNDTYVVQCFIGAGAFGEVYRVKHKYLGMQVIKVFKESYVAETDLDAVTNEAKILANLTHSNIVRVFETNKFEKQDKTYFFLTMGFVSGETLAQLLRRKISLSIEVCLSIQIAYLRGLHTAHKQNPPIIHRDISPDNILLSYDGEKPRAMLSDFGLAQSVDQLSHLSEAAGKYLYFAPECFWGVYLPASDIFSCGIVFYRMLTGTHPWGYDFDELETNNLDDVSKMIVVARKRDPLPPSYYNEECSENLDKIALRSLSNDLETRYRNASEFLLDLIGERKTLESDLEPTQKMSVEDLYY